MKKIGMILASLLICTSLSFAQGLQIGPEIGFFKAEDADGEFMFGAQARLKLSESFGIEGAIDYRNEEYNNGAAEITSYPVQLTALLFPIPFVYGAAGAGWYNTNITIETSLGDFEDTSQEFGYHLGGGVQFDLNNKLALSGDIRYVFLDYSFDIEEVPFEDVDANFFVIKAALLIKL